MRARVRAAVRPQKMKSSPRESPQKRRRRGRAEEDRSPCDESLMAGKGQKMTPVVHKFMHKIAGDESKRALLGADEIDRNQRQNAGEEEPGDNFPEGYWNRPCCWRLCE